MTDEPDPRNRPSETMLPVVHQAVAPDGSLVRLLCEVPGGGMAHFELAAGEVSVAQQHRTVSEIWFVLAGLGRMWRRGPGGETSEIDLRPDVALTIPVGTAFQFRNDGRVPLQAIGATMPPWPGEGEAFTADGPWEPRIG